GRHRLDSAVGKPDRGDSKGRCCLDSGWGEALARRYTKYIDDAHRNTGTAKRQSRRVDGESDRRAIPQVISVLPERQELKMKVMTLMITVLSLISPICAQDQHTQTERKSDGQDCFFGMRAPERLKARCIAFGQGLLAKQCSREELLR